MGLIAVSIAWAAVGLTAPAPPPERIDNSQDATATGTIGLVPMEAVEGIDAGLRELLEASVVAGLGRNPAVQVKRLDEHDGSCSDACWNRRGIEQGATHIVVLSVEVRERRYRIGLQLRDASSNEVLASVARECDVCGLADVRQLIEAEAAKLPQNVADALRPAVIVITTTPAAASVHLDGRRVGESPTEQQVSPGPHRIGLSKAGYGSVERSVIAEPGVRQRISVRLPAASSAPTRPWLRPLGITAVVAGVATIGASVPLFILEERPVGRRCHGASINDDGLCRWRYRTLEGGVALALVGTATLAAGIALLVKARRARQASATSSVTLRLSQAARW